MTMPSFLSKISSKFHKKKKNESKEVEKHPKVEKSPKKEKKSLFHHGKGSSNKNFKDSKEKALGVKGSKSSASTSTGSKTGSKTGIKKEEAVKVEDNVGSGLDFGENNNFANDVRSPSSTASPPLFDGRGGAGNSQTAHDMRGYGNERDMQFVKVDPSSAEKKNFGRHGRSLIDLDNSFDETDEESAGQKDRARMVEYQQRNVQFMDQPRPYSNYQLSPQDMKMAQGGQGNNFSFATKVGPEPLDTRNLGPPGLFPMPSPTESSSFCLSTDVDDEEYNRLRHRGMMPPMTSPSSASSHSSDGYGLFPNLDTNANNMGGAMQITPMEGETEDDLRAWTPSPRNPTNPTSPNLFSFDTDDRNAAARAHHKLTQQVANAKNENNPALANKQQNVQANSVPVSAMTDPYGDSTDSEFETNSSFAPLVGESLLATSVESNDSFSDDVFPNVALADGLSPASSSPQSFASPRSNQDSDRQQQQRNTADPNNFFDAAWPQQHEFSNQFRSSPVKQQQQQPHPIARSFSPDKKSRQFHPNSPNTNAQHTSSPQHHHDPPPLRSEKPHTHQRHHSNPRTKDDTQHSPQTNAPRHRSVNSAPVISLSNKSPTSPKDKDVLAQTTSTTTKIKRKKRRKESRLLASYNETSDGSSDEASDDNNDWLFDEVTGALGPRGITADLESLGGRSNRSNRSKTSKGSKSHRSTRSHRSTKSHKSGTSRRSRRQHHHHPSGSSVGSKNSHISHRSSRSTRSHLSHMSEASRSVANDLLRLEMQLAMVGSNEKNPTAIPSITSGNASVPTGSGSVGGNSRASYTSGHYSMSNASRSSRKSNSVSRASSTAARRNKITVVAPPGKLGIILANKFDSKGTVISGVRSSSVLADKLHPGDRIIAVDGEDVSRMTVAEITTIMARKNDFERNLTILTTPKSSSSSPTAASAMATATITAPSAYDVTSSDVNDYGDAGSGSSPVHHQHLNYTQRN